MFCSGKELLNWLNKSAKLGGAFKRTEVFLLEISMQFFLNTEEEKSYSVKYSNGSNKPNEGSDVYSQQG